MRINKKLILITLLVSTIFLFELEADFYIIILNITGIRLSDKPSAIIGIIYSIFINIKTLNGVTKPLFRAKEKSKWLLALMIILHALSILVLLISLLFLPMAFSQPIDY